MNISDPKNFVQCIKELPKKDKNISGVMSSYYGDHYDLTINNGKKSIFLTLLKNGEFMLSEGGIDNLQLKNFESHDINKITNEELMKIINRKLHN